MPFKTILNRLVANTNGAVGAILLDWEGEAVEIATSEASIDDLKLIGAYQAVFLDRLKKICSSSSIGAPDRFEIHLEKAAFLNCVLIDGYYAVLVVRGQSHKGVAWQRLEASRHELLEEM